MPKKKQEKKQYTATAQIMGKEYTGVGETVYEAIGSIKTPGVFGKVILTVTTEKKSKERVIPVVAARRAFMSLGMTREIGLKNISLGFDGL